MPDSRPVEGCREPATTGRIDGVRPDHGTVWTVLAAVLDDVRCYKVGEGARLPSEAQMAARFGVSRATVARVMWLLRWTGLVVGRPGGAVRVAEEPSRTLALQLIERAYEVRRLNGDTALLGADPHLQRDCPPEN